MTDNRRMSETRESIKLRNQSAVYEVMKSIGAPASVSEIHSKTGGITERTVRRAIDGLINAGHAMEAGKRHSSQLYSLRDQMPIQQAANARVPYGNTRLPVADFIDLMASESTNPLRLGGENGTRRDIVSPEMSDAIRQRMAFVILTSGEPGFNNAVNKYHNGLISIANELEHLTGIVKSFVDSPIWYDHYRDGLANGVRELKKDNPELFQLAKDYIANLGNKEG